MDVSEEQTKPTTEETVQQETPVVVATEKEEEKPISKQFDYGTDVGTVIIYFKNWQRVLDDSQELSAFPVDDKTLKSFYPTYPTETIEAFNKIAKFSRE